VSCRPCRAPRRPLRERSGNVGAHRIERRPGTLAPPDPAGRTYTRHRPQEDAMDAALSCPDGEEYMSTLRLD